IVSYTVSGILLIVAYRKIRPITIFGKPSDVPHHFIREQIKQYGRVTKIEPSQQYGPLLVVQHRPPAKIMFWSNKTISIKIDGIDVNANGYSWLQSVVADKNICFIPMKHPTSPAHIECRVCLKDSQKHIDVGEALLSLGFAKLSVPVPKTIRNRKDVYAVAVYQYYRTLAKAERYAKDRRNGLWQSLLAPRLWPLSLWPTLLDRVTNPSRLPALVK
uniref:TNase-like domain-containing protein n=1 Tax=Anopheles epiroticus TaxID=199890 RepID=A0A182PHX5_9DIPT